MKSKMQNCNPTENVYSCTAEPPCVSGLTGFAREHTTPGAPGPPGAAQCNGSIQ